MWHKKLFPFFGTKPRNPQEISESDIEAHFQKLKYGDFTLTGAVLPSLSLELLPVAGFRKDHYVDHRVSVPVLMISASAEDLLPLFMDLIELIDEDIVDVVLETSHSLRQRRPCESHVDVRCDDIECVILQSYLWEYEDLILRDGNTGIAVMEENVPMEVQLDEHKLICFYGWECVEARVMEILREYGLKEKPDMKFMTSGEHIHTSSDRFENRFHELATQLGADDWRNSQH